MRALYRAIAHALRRWLHAVRRRPDAARPEEQTGRGEAGREPHDTGAGADSCEARATAYQEERQPSPAGDIAPSSTPSPMSVATEHREGPSASDAPGLGAHIESDPVTAGRREGDRLYADECFENQALADVAADAGKSAVHEDNGARGSGAAPAISPVVPEKALAPEGGSDNDGTTDNERHAGGTVHSAPLGEADPAERSDATKPDAAGSERPAEPVTAAAEQEADALADDMRPCPRCGVTCRPDEVKRIFGYRTMRWTTTGGESTAVRRQSYCRKCRGVHTVESRERIDLNEQSDEQNLDEHSFDPTPDDRQPADGGVEQHAPPELDGARDRDDTHGVNHTTTAATKKRVLERPAPEYRAPTGGLHSPRQSPPPRNHGDDQGEPSTLVRPARVEVRILFQRGGYCTVSLLASRPPGLPERLTVSSGAGEVELLELQEDWYEAEVAVGLADLLRNGFRWTDRETGQEWVLSRREVFVLASGTEHRGFVSCPRLVVGREHLVLCAVAQLAAVEKELSEAECSGWTQLGEDDGVPAGWKVLQAVWPQRPVPLGDDNNILNVLRPLPDVEIALEEGIRLTRNQWLLGYPPKIRIYGDPAHTGKVLIDGEEAARSEQGGYKAPGWDTEGEHWIWCGNTSKSYSLARGQSSWERWAAYSFSLPGTKGKGEKLALCGPVVWSGTIESHPDQRRAIPVPPSNPVLLGSRPGEVYFAYQRPDVHGAPCLGSPPFNPVWALPAQPLHGDKRRDRILMVGEPLAAHNDAGGRQRSGTDDDVKRWYQMILNASRKGLAVEPESLATDQLWRSYKQLARRLRKLSR